MVVRQKSEVTSVVYVKKCDAKTVKELLEHDNNLNKDYRMVAVLTNGLIAIPVKCKTINEDSAWRDKVLLAGEHECPYSTSKLGNNRLGLEGELTRVQQGVWNWLGRDMKVKQEILCLNVVTCPKKLELFGDDRTLIIPRKAFSLEDEAFRSLAGTAKHCDLWRNLAQVFGSSRVAMRGDIDPQSPIRESGHMLLWPFEGKPKHTGPASPGWITVTEQGIQQSLDMTRVMFSRGNITEKIRFGKLVQQGEVVLDLYAGIGYYTLPALVHGKAAHVYACEWNEHAVLALKFNLKANAVDHKATVLFGDCRTNAREHGLVGICDRVSLGLLPSSEGGWRTAVKALRKSSGGWLHVHGNVPEQEQEQWGLWISWRLANLAIDEVSPDWVSICFHVERVKSFAPTVYHYVADIFVGPREKLGNYGVNLTMGSAISGLIKSTQEFVPLLHEPSKPSCALDHNGVLHQAWMMESTSQ